MILRVKTTEDWNRLEIAKNDGIATLWRDGILLGHVKKKVFLKTRKETCIQYMPIPEKTISLEEPMIIMAVIQLEGWKYVKHLILRADGKIETYEEGYRIEEVSLKKGEPLSYIYWQGKKPTLYESDGTVCQIMVPNCHEE